MAKPICNSKNGITDSQVNYNHFWGQGRMIFGKREVEAFFPFLIGKQEYY